MSPPSLRTFVLKQAMDNHARVPAVLGEDATDVITPVEEKLNRPSAVMT